MLSCAKCSNAIDVTGSLEHGARPSAIEAFANSQFPLAARARMDPACKDAAAQLLVEEKTALDGLSRVFSGAPKQSSELSSLKFDEKMRALTAVFELSSAKCEIDHPVCNKCAKDISAELDRRLEQLSLDRDVFRSALKDLKSSPPATTQEEDEQTLSALEKEDAEVRETLAKLYAERVALQNEMRHFNSESGHLGALEHQFWRDYQTFQLELDDINQQQLIVSQKVQSASVQLERLKRTNVFDDAFHIYYDGHFGVINGFRLGRLPSQPVEWEETNAALGQVCLLLQTVAEHCNFEFTKYTLLPKGSFSKIAERTDPDKTAVELHRPTDLRFAKLFWYPRFDKALVRLLACVAEFGEHAHSLDSKFRFKYPIEKDTINGLSIKAAQLNSDADWTRALKYMLTNLKFLLAWASKHSGH